MSKITKTLKTLTDEDWKGIRKVARAAFGMAGILECDLDDIKQELALQLVREAHRFKPKISSWATFRGTVLHMRMARIIRDRKRPSTRYMISPQISLEDIYIHGNGENEDMTWFEAINEDGLFTDGTEKPEIPRLGMQIDVAEFIRKLQPPLRNVCLSLQYRNVTETARYLKLSSRSIHRRMEQIRTLMIEAGLDSYVLPQNVSL